MLITRGFGVVGAGSSVYVPILDTNTDIKVSGSTNMHISTNLPIFSSNDTTSLVPKVSSSSIKSDIVINKLLPKLTTS